MEKQKKTKVFFDAFPLIYERPSGIGHLLVETIRALEKNQDFTKDYQIVLIAPKSGLKNLERWKFKTVTHKAVPVKGRIWSALVLFRLLLPADLFFGKGIYVFGNYTTWPLLFSKSVTYIHDLNFLVNPKTVNPKTQRILRKNIPVWIKRADHLATISEFSKKEIIKFYKVPKDKITVLLCGVDREIFYPTNEDIIEETKKKYDIKGEYLFFLSNVEPRKNIDRLLDAYSMLSKNLTDTYSLVIVGGDGWLNDSALKKISEFQKTGLKVIRPKQYVPDEDLPALLSGATLLLHPALYEGFGISPLQAMACGTPVLVSNSTSLPEVVGNAGIYVDPNSTEDIREKIEDTLNNKKMLKKYSKLSLEQAKKFTWSTSAFGLIEIIRHLLK